MNTSSLHLRSYSSEITSHTHSFHQWVLPLQGSLELEIGKRSQSINSSHGAFIQLNEPHCCESHESNQFLVLDVLPNHPWMQNNIPSFWKLTPTFQHYLAFAKIYLDEHPQDSNTILIIKDFLLTLLSQHFLTSFDKKILVAKNWIDAHFYKTISTKEVANLCHLSVSQLQRRFKAALGCGVAEYWRNVRLERAKVLLNTPSSSIEHIAHHIGYESLAAFSRCFSRDLGITPSEWRATNGKKHACNG